ncbi:MAG TPA: hypothetical protein VM240_12445 [Verrucomicrobiae bacterium]|nr:hypothetical protein [Verrucomicrobiae bacterium]
MALVASLKQWWKSRQGRPLQELLAVDFDDKEIRVRVLADLEAEWNQTFLWSDITRVCFKDGGILSSDIVYVTLRDCEKVAQVPTEAKDGHKFFGELCERGLFPEEIWRKAAGDTSGGMHCWPPFEK